MCVLILSTRMQLNAVWDALGVPDKYRQQMAGMKLRPWETFLLKRLVRNLKGSQVGSFKCSISLYFLVLYMLCLLLLYFFHQVIKLFEALDLDNTMPQPRENSDKSMDLVNQKSMEI